ncbi:hypothetical protein ACG7TL_001235 [Trametes sanguinea]
MLRFPRLICCASFFLVAVTASATSLVPANGTLGAHELFKALQSLNVTVQGRLRASVPLAKPCFSVYDGEHVPVDPTACSVVQSNYTNPDFRASQFAAYMVLQSEVCEASPQPDQCLLNNADPSDPAAFTGTDCRLGNIPPLYIEVAGPSDVQAALRFSKETGVRLSVKNQGHDYKHRSSGKGTLALWTTRLTSMSHNAQFKPEGCSSTYDAITVGAGVQTQEVYEFADKVNRTIVGGYHQSIGFGGGYFLGGGHSVLSPVYGLAVDRVVQVKIVSPDGEYRTANECQNSDLFFALRGGGGSAFGVVIESSHRTEPQITLQAAVLNFTTQSTDDLAQWYTLMVNNSYRWANEGWGGHIFGPSLIHVNPLLSNVEAEKSMGSAIDFVRARGGSAVVEQFPSWLTFFNKYVLAAEAPVGFEISGGTRLLPSTLFKTESGRAQLSSLISSALPFASPEMIAGTPWLFKSTPNETSVTPAWRDAIWHMALAIVIPYNLTLAERTETYQSAEEHLKPFRDLSPESGVYFNEGDVYEPNHEQAYWGDNYPKLLEVKRKYDPDGLLDCWQCVGWRGPSDPLYQCYIKI